jgi:hypothetical protein
MLLLHCGPQVALLRLLLLLPRAILLKLLLSLLLQLSLLNAQQTVAALTAAPVGLKEVAAANVAPTCRLFFTTFRLLLPSRCCFCCCPGCHEC